MLILFEWSAAFITWFLVRVQPYWKRLEPFIRLFILISITLIVTFWVAVFSYLILYFFYVPFAKISHPLNFRFGSDCKRSGEFTGIACSFPQDNITIENDGKTVLNFGQSYKVFVNIEVPESEINRKIGMFMVGMKMFGKKGNLIEDAQKPVMLNYKSPLLEQIETMIFAPLYVFGSKSQMQTLSIEIFSDLTDNPYDNIKYCQVTIYTDLLQYYSSNIQLYANFSGLRSFMFFYPIFSAFCFVTAFFVCLNFVVLINWLHRQWVKLETDQNLNSCSRATFQEGDGDNSQINLNLSDNIVEIGAHNCGHTDRSSDDDWPEPRPISISGRKIKDVIGHIENVGGASISDTKEMKKTN